MGILDKAIEMLGGDHLPMMDSRMKLMQAALSLLANNGRSDGVHGLVHRFNQAGLGNVIQSWIGTGQNVPVTAEQLRQVLDHGQLRAIADETGLSEREAARQLSDMLPDLVDKLTPAGHIPPGGLGNVSTLLDHFLGRYH
ncbi:MAG TPA: YidB family protein [Noviherbaspirillum sp.]|nr:YidB family protein [Noviherbaspirillum sp.]HZW21188.1 YidB family protein [Noviherbaspirillum sp.]